MSGRYGRDGEFVVVLSPTDQGYYEPDTSQLIRLKLASEYGYGINPATALTDKVNLLGTGAHPFWRWLQKTCRNPLGIGRIEGNFEKFLLDGRTGLPLRRYPRKYKPTDIKNDIEAIIAGMTEAKAKTGKGKPVCVLLYTEMGNGVDFMMHTHAWHGKAPNDAQLENGLVQNISTLADY